jgi:hypothetical protein
MEREKEGMRRETGEEASSHKAQASTQKLPNPERNYLKLEA